MQETRKREIRIKADSFRANCKIGRYGIIDLFKECERMDYKLLRYPLGENADLGFMTKRDNDIHRFKQHMQGDKSSEQYLGEITEEELDKYRYIHPYMYERKMDDRVIEIFDIGYDKETECITFPIRDKNGNCLFIARRSVKTKFFSYPQGVEKPLYGLYELYQLDEFPKEIYICESMIDAITIWTHYDKYAVALNGLGNDLQFSQLNNMPNRTFILATDNDSAGIKARIRLKKYITNKIIKEIILPSNRKDINECTYDELENIKLIF